MTNNRGVVFIAGFCIVISLLLVSVSETFAGKATFRAGVTPARINLSVNPQGGITGQRTFTVDVHRTRVGSSVACNKIQALEVLRGTDPLPLDESLVLARFGGFGTRKGKCYFDVNLRVRPFSDEEIRSVCRGTPGAIQNLSVDGLVTAWNKPADYLVYLRDMRRKGGMGGGSPKNTAPIRFAARVNCTGGSPISDGPGDQAGSGGGNGTGATTTGGSHGNTQCDLTGTWIGYDNGQRAADWKFTRLFTAGSSTTYRATHLTRQGSPSGNEGAMTQSPSGYYLFLTLPTRVPGANSSYQASTMRIYDANARCDKLTERQLYDSTVGKGNRGGNYWLQRARTKSAPRSPIGKPGGVKRPYAPRPAPTKPGSSSQPKWGN